MRKGKDTKLPVGFNQVLYELHVVEVHRARVVLVHRGDLGHFGGGEGEVEDVEVLRHALPTPSSLK